MRETVPIILSRGHLYCVFPKFFFYFLKCLDKMVSDAGNVGGKRRKGQQRMRCLDGITDSMDMRLSKVQEIGKDREAWSAAAHGVTKSWA